MDIQAAVEDRVGEDNPEVAAGGILVVGILEGPEEDSLGRRRNREAVGEDNLVQPGNHLEEDTAEDKLEQPGGMAEGGKLKEAVEDNLEGDNRGTEEQPEDIQIQREGKLGLEQPWACRPSGNQQHLLQ